jgi:NAD(P)-dependent dehydrogenase (short-subunit alcohol dehydrogenase family)
VTRTAKESALVTGGVRRIGAFLAQHLATRGYHVFVHAHTASEESKAFVQKIIADGGSAELVTADLGNAANVQDMMAAVLACETPLAVIINNASYFEYDFPSQANNEILQKSLAAHLYGPFYIFESLKNRTSHNLLTIINMLDQKLENVNPDYYSYTIGKMGLYGLTKIWQSAELPNIRTFGILLGLTLTSGEQSKENYDISRRNNPLGRSPKLSEIASLIDFFLAYPTLQGQTFALDGGESLVPRLRDVALDPGLHGRS